MNRTGFRGKSISPKILTMIERDLAKPEADKKEVAKKHNVSLRTVQAIHKSMQMPPILVKGVTKNI